MLSSWLLKVLICWTPTTESSEDRHDSQSLLCRLKDSRSNVANAIKPSLLFVVRTACHCHFFECVLHPLLSGVKRLLFTRRMLDHRNNVDERFVVTNLCAFCRLSTVNRSVVALSFCRNSPSASVPHPYGRSRKSRSPLPAPDFLSRIAQRPRDSLQVCIPFRPAPRTSHAELTSSCASYAITKIRCGAWIVNEQTWKSGIA